MFISANERISHSNPPGATTRWIRGDISSIPLYKLWCRSFLPVFNILRSNTSNRALDAVYSFPMAVIFKGSCGPLCSSPRTEGISTPDPDLLIWGCLSVGEISNLRIRVTRNACTSITLSNRRSSASLGDWTSRSTHANRHPMQFLTPPENVELCDERSVFNVPTAVRKTAQIPICSNR